jgi:hypothetical protein
MRILLFALSTVGTIALTKGTMQVLPRRRTEHGMSFNQLRVLWRRKTILVPLIAALDYESCAHKNTC